ncbi:LRR receptor-like serine/threonine-protein kinase [Populus alba x Populus x berolinensis]|nr:LRR receptor-like serine/threonine-protein kinase [Populus alba x Populus x berolinensis]
MLTMFQLCQVMVMISFSSSITLLASDQLHPGEVEALRQIGKTVNEDGQLSLKFVDSCQPNGLVKTELTSAPPNLEGNSTIECNCSITDDNYCRITSFLLKDYSLPGRLPPELANLTYVQKIDFTRNYLYDTIPVEWASMKNLSFISLAANRLSGNIPAHLGSFTALTYLNLESNQFSGVVPPELGKLVNLKTLILSGNKLVGTLPEALAQIKNLTDFRVSDNNLNGTVPEFIGNWTQLQKLVLYATGLQGLIPLAIFYLEKLSDLRIADMPGPEFQLPNVTIRRDTLVLRNINLTGTIPENAWKVAGTIPENAWKVETTLDLTFNKLVGEIPPNFQHKMLTMFQLCQVMVMISFSSSITLLASDQLHPGEVEALRQIGKTVNEDGQLSLKFVDSCRPNGLVKTELTSAPPNLEGNSTIECNCSITDDNYCHITSFQLKDYSLPGRLPQELANLTYVQKIDFTRNYLYGTIPVEWASMKNLSFISLTANRLSGNIPGHLGSFTALTYLSLESNQFSGVVPPELGKLVNLKTLILSGNKLVGTLPEALAQIKDLKDFRVSDNNLNGTVPEFIGNWTQLQKLDLYATGLQGPIPLAIFHLEKLSDLRIADMPGPEFQLPNSPIERQFLVLRNINLTGTIPENAWKVEKTLDLTFNKLVGEIPPNTIRRRQFTFLSGNKLTGTVQDSFLQNSPNLDVSYNNFSRSPRCSSNYRSFHINCGGQDVKNGKILYEGDQDSGSNAAARSYRTYCEEPEETSKKPIVIGVVTSAAFLILLVMGFIYWKLCYGHKYTKERELKGLDLKTGSFTLRQLKAATDNFNSENKIGEGGFGSVYKGELADGTIIAVKQLSPKSRQGNREFVNEIGMISCLQHPNLVRLYGCCIEGDQLLLVYEYMENNSLSRALFGNHGSIC